jgi:nitroreductase
VKERISETCTRFSRKTWAAFAPENAKYLAQRGGTWDKRYMKNVPALIAVCYNVPEKMREEVALASAWAAIENMLLAATAEKLGSCIYTFCDSEEENELRGILKIPRQYRLAAIIQLGYTDYCPPSPSRKRLEEIVSYQHF